MSTMQTEDWYIIYRCLSGDAAAFGPLVDKYRESVYALAYSRLRDTHDAEDVTQEVFIKVYEKLYTLRRWDSFPGWLYVTTSNLCMDWIRSRSRRPDRDYVDEHPKILQARSMDSHRLDLVCESLYQELNSLPKMHRQVLALHYLGGMSVREIARLSGTSQNTIKQRLRRARLRLREKMLAAMDGVYDSPGDTSHCDIATYEDGIMKTTAALCMLLAAMPALAGTFRDDFSDGNINGWTPYNATPGLQCGEWTVRDGVLHYRGSAERTICFLTMGDASWTDYTISCRARMIENLRPGNFARIIFAAHMAEQPGFNCIYYVFGPTPVGDAIGIGTPDGDENWKMLDIEMFRWYELEAEIVGTNQRFFVDGQLMVEHQIQTYQSGRLGIGCVGAEIEYDDVVITGTDVPDLNMAVSTGKLATTWGTIRSQ